jgi:hypothetical protein
MADLVLPAVDGWPPPPAVTVPIYGLVDWTGPQWLVLWDGNEDDGLRLVQLLHGDPETNRPVLEVITYAKQPAKDLGGGTRAVATSLAEVADKVVLFLLSQLSERLPADERQSWARERWDSVVAATELGSASDALVWSAAIITVEQQVLPCYRLTVDDGWAICLDTGEVFVGLYGTQPYSPVLAQLTDLTAYPMPTDDDEPFMEPPEEPAREVSTYAGGSCHWAGLAADSPEDPPFLVECECGKLYKGPYPTWEAAQDASDSHLDNQPFEFPSADSIVVHPPSAEQVAAWGDFPRAGGPRNSPELRQLALDRVVTSGLPMVGVVALPIVELAQRLALQTDRLSDGQFDRDVAYFEVNEDAYFLRQWTVEVVTEVYAYVVPDPEGSFAGRAEMRRFMTRAGLGEKQVLFLPAAATGGT